MKRKPNTIFLFSAVALAGLCVWGGQPAAAQRFPKTALKWKFSFSHQLTAAKVERILAERVKRTAKQLPPIPKQYLRAWGAEELPAENPVYWKARRPFAGPYDEVPFWDRLSPQAKQNYFLSANNRALQTLIRDRTRALDNVRRLGPDLWKQRVRFPQRTWDIAALSQFMLQRVPKDVDYLLLGEEHNQPVIQALVLRFLRQYKAQNPERKIFLLTEFLPKGGVKNLTLKQEERLFPRYARLLASAQKAGLYVRGLEPPFAVYSQSGTVVDSRVLDCGEDVSVVDTFSMPEGVRLRNRAWLEEIKSLRKQYPDALFIIYAGDMHLNYESSQSVGVQLPPEKTFFISVLFRTKEERPIMHTLDLLPQSRYPFWNQKVLTWEDPALRRAAGFDIRILLTPEDAVRPANVRKPLPGGNSNRR